MDNTRPSTVWLNGEKPKLGDTATSKQVGRSGRAIHIAENVLLHYQLGAQGTGNPELSGEAVASPKCVETIYHPSHADEEIVHSSGKLEGTVHNRDGHRLGHFAEPAASNRVSCNPNRSRDVHRPERSLVLVPAEEALDIV